MAKFQMNMPDDILDDVQFLERNVLDIFKGMVSAGAEVAAKNMKQRAGKAFKSGIGPKVNAGLKVTKAYETKRKEIAAGARYYGYIAKKGGGKFVLKKGGKTYTYAGVPIPLLVNLADSGKSIKSTMVPQFRDYWNGIKYPIITPAFADVKGIEGAMLRAQEKLSGGLLK